MSLQQYNRGAMMLHLASAVGFGTYFLAKDSTTPPGVDLTVRDHQLTFTDVSGNLTYAYSSESDMVVTIQQIQYLLVAFFIITACFHLYYYLADGIISNQYSEMIRTQNNWVRWIEYSLSATMMLYIIAFLAGVKDKNVYYLITATNVAMMMQGQWIEQNHAEGKSVLAPMATGFGLLLAEFAIIYRDFQRRQKAEQVSGFTQPSWEPTAVLVMFLFFATFGFISLYASFTNTSYYGTEVMYIMASFIAKNWLGRYICAFVL